ncbi:substrate-binding domain-containing protein [Cryptosporangium sp. NPDC048952]|uniref:substrate-binding domain-containing protein n=1 Tax=Cryptosporangium sp. NPDC048952 TaxID=3363961 RepID=UPI0037185A7B
MGLPRKVRASLLVVAVLLAAVGCGNSESDDGAAQAETGGLIGISMPSGDQARWITDGENLSYQFERMGYTADVEVADGKPAKQIQQIQQMIDSGARALVISAVDGKSLTGVLEKAHEAKVKVIAYDRLIEGTPDVDYFATFDGRRVGVLQASYLVDALGLRNGGEPVTMELFAGSADDNNASVFYKGAMSVLQPFIASGRLDVRSGQTSFSAVTTKAWSDEVARQRMARILDEYYQSDDLDAVLSPYDGMSRGVLQAITAAGKKRPVITGQDAEIESVKLIASGKQDQTVFKDTRKLAELAANMVKTLLTGGTPTVTDTTQFDNGVKVVPTALLQPVTVVKSNYEKILVGSSYYSAAQVGLAS